MNLICCVGYPAIHESIISQSANLLSDDGLLGLGVYFQQMQGNSVYGYACSSWLADGNILTTMSGTRHQLGCFRYPATQIKAFTNTVDLGRVFATQRQLLANHKAIPWEEREVERIVIDLWNEAFNYNEQLGILLPMTTKDLTRVQNFIEDSLPGKDK